MSAREPRHTNRLIKETSPYLLQHAHNPVDWYSWGEEALRAAGEQDKPILLSIGYSSCHWCHVMEHESFEDEETSALMNENFINIKVDREERPDLDAIYMNYVQMTTGSGGWPLTVFLSPDQVPFYGGTYFPPEDSYGRPGFKRLLTNLAEAYGTRRGDLDKNREEIMGRLKRAAQWGSSEGDLEVGVLEEAYGKVLHQFDWQHGGFGGAPKFPSTMVLGFLLRYYRRTGTQAALDMVHLSLNEMGHGGIYDQLGGGFHRYSVDERWLVPHFEKMLYDNALLSGLYLEAYQVSGDSYYREIVQETLRYVQREMMDPIGGFYSSQDADSEGEEGKFYVWTPAEVETVLGSKDAEIFNEYYGVSASGNFEGKNILHHRIDLKGLSKSLGMLSQELKNFLDQARYKLFKAREPRVKPGLDDKVLAAWNGMMLTRFAEASFALNDHTFLETAVRNAGFLASEMLIDGRLVRSWKQGKAHLNAYLEDYALVIEGWLATYQVTGDIRWLDHAARLMELQFDLFWDDAKGDFYFTSSDHETLLVRQKEYLDNATPGGNSVTCLNLLRLGVLLGRKDYRDRAEQIMRQLSSRLCQSPLAFGNWLQALDFLLGPSQEIAVVGESTERAALLQPLRESFLPNRVLVFLDTIDKGVVQKIPLLEGKTAIDGRPTVYVCQDYACQEPVTTAEGLTRVLQATG
ncbi:thioredoxin domain-containing protein [Acidobacteria bacterium AH-259-D05]|nr:thioredoxin domain-containing protein [Acidobacteria bacterium AH-259-D05]